MPNYKTHLAGGFLSFGILYKLSAKVLSKRFYSSEEMAFSLLLCLLGSLFPDIDTKSYGQRMFYFLLFAMTFGAILLNQWTLLIVFSIFSVFPFFIRHRGITHRPWFLAIAPLPIFITIFDKSSKLAMLSKTGYFYFLAGALSHIFLDYFKPIKRLKKFLLK